MSKYIDNYSTAEYSYNINGLRESKTVTGVKTRYIYNQENIIGEIFDDNIYTYYRGTELIGYTNNKGDRYYYRQNSHGDVTALLTIDGEEKKTYSYNAYGKETPFTLAPMGNQTVIQLWKAETEQIQNPFRYCGEYQDNETGLIYLRNRYYDNSIGRFITEDPIRDGLNWYVYCGNNPIRYTDSFGLDKNLDDYINTNYAKKMTVTICIERPVPNSREVATITAEGVLNNGHTFLRLDDGKGNIQYLGIGAANKSLIKMITGQNVEGTTIDDSESSWNVAKTFEINTDQYNVLDTYLSNTKASPPEYNIESYNCTTWAVEGLQKAGIYSYNLGIYKHHWTLPENIYDQLKGYSARGRIPTWLASAAVRTMGRFTGYTPADAAQDVKSSRGKVLLQYEGLSGIKEIQNKAH